MRNDLRWAIIDAALDAGQFGASKEHPNGQAAPRNIVAAKLREFRRAGESNQDLMDTLIHLRLVQDIAAK
jgi:hypothetical protein